MTSGSPVKATGCLRTKRNPRSVMNMAASEVSLPFETRILFAALLCLWETHWSTQGGGIHIQTQEVVQIQTGSVNAAQVSATGTSECTHVLSLSGAQWACACISTMCVISPFPCMLSGYSITCVFLLAFFFFLRETKCLLHQGPWPENGTVGHTNTTHACDMLRSSLLCPEVNLG